MCHAHPLLAIAGTILGIRPVRPSPRPGQSAAWVQRTRSGAAAVTLALEALHRTDFKVVPVQEYLAFRNRSAPVPATS